jgi:hypothetical protein
MSRKILRNFAAGAPIEHNDGEAKRVREACGPPYFLYRHNPLFPVGKVGVFQKLCQRDAPFSVKGNGLSVDDAVQPHTQGWGPGIGQFIRDNPAVLELVRACTKSGILALQTPKFYLAGSIEPKVRRARKSGFLRSIDRKNPQFE